MNSYYIPFNVTTVHGTHSNMSRFPKMVLKYQVAEFLTFYILLLVGTMLRCTNSHLKQYIQSNPQLSTVCSQQFEAVCQKWQ